MGAYDKAPTHGVFSHKHDLGCVVAKLSHPSHQEDVLRVGGTMVAVTDVDVVWHGVPGFYTKLSRHRHARRLILGRRAAFMINTRLTWAIEITPIRPMIGIVTLFLATDRLTAEQLFGVK